MIRTLRRAKLERARLRWMVMASVMSVVAAPAFAQAPTEAQREAIKTDCRNDYIAHCSSIPPGGEASLQCLAKNMSSLSGTCQAAVRAVQAPAAAPTTLVLRRMLPREELFVTRSACAADIGTLCQGVVPGGGRIMQCLSARSASLSPACRDVLTPFAVQ